MELVAIHETSDQLDIEYQLETGTESFAQTAAPVTNLNMVHLQANSFQCVLSWRKLLIYLDFFVNDIIVTLFSLSDIVLDILVCIEFYKQSRMFYFYISMAIFIVAQLTYSFLFVATWGKHLSAFKQIAVFSMITPVSQFVPVFTWVESFRFERFSMNIYLNFTSYCALFDRMMRHRLDSFLTGVGLQPTADPLADTEVGYIELFCFPFFVIPSDLSSF